MNQPDFRWYVFVTVWIVLTFASLGFFFGSRNAKLKKRVFPWFILLSGALFAFFVVWIGFPPEILFLLVPAVALIGWLNLRMTKFCESCGATIISQAWFAKAKYCSRCGAALENHRSHEAPLAGAHRK